jgi:hypothetical protein
VCVPSCRSNGLASYPLSAPGLTANEELIRRGVVFSVFHRDTNVANGRDIQVLIQTGNLEVYAEFTYVCEGASHVDLYEGDTFVFNGTMMTAQNRNRAVHGILTPQSQFWYSPTFSVQGTTIGQWLNPSSSKEVQNFLLKPNTKYRLDLNNNSGVSADMSVEIDFYERNLDLV